MGGMIDIAWLREHPDTLRVALARRGLEMDLDGLIRLDVERRQVRMEAEQDRAEQKRLGLRIRELAGDEKASAVAEASDLAARYREGVAEADRLDRRFSVLWAQVPNLADPSSADGLTEEDGVEIRRWGEVRDFGFPVQDHRRLGSDLGMIDIERAAKVSGSRFGYLMGPAVRLEFALVGMVFDRLEGYGFTPFVPPVLVREEALYGTGFFPDDSGQVYEIPNDGLYLVGTSEVSLAAYHSNEVLDEDRLPLRYAGFSTCFRREAGAHGKDTAGIFRVHQFDKVEMFAFCHPEQSQAEHERLLAIEEEIVQSLEIPYRVVNIAAGDLGASAAKKYDIEAWIPSQGRYREITSCSNTTDFQSRRLRIRYRTAQGNRLVHTLNGTAAAIGRLLIALMENHQQSDGSILVPDALQSHAGFDRIRPPDKA